jgi:hypothetical protein
MGWKKEPVKRYGGEDYMAKKQRLDKAYQYAKMNKTPKTKLNLFLLGLLGFVTAAVMMGIIFVICYYM